MKMSWRCGHVQRTLRVHRTFRTVYFQNRRRKMNAAKLLAGGLLLGMGIATGGATLGAAAAGVGVNWLGEGAAGLWAGLAARPEAALARAYAAAIRDGSNDLAQRYRATVDGRADLAAFHLVAACADEVAAAEFPPGGVDAGAAQRGLAAALAALLHGHDERQVAFLQRELLPACAAAFQKRLLQDEAAWRAFHGLVLQGLAANSGALMAHMENFTRLLTGWSDPAATLAQLRRLAEKIDALARQPADAPVFDNRGMTVGGNVHQATGNQYFHSAHAEGGGPATVINTLGGAASPAAPAPAGPGVVLLLAANPVGTERLRLDQEARAVTLALRQGGGRLHLAQEWAVRSSALLDGLLHHRPAIVHFAGHGSDSHLLLEGEDGQPATLGAEALASLLAVGGGVRCVVFNACWSDSMAEALLRVIPCVVGMAGALADTAAIAFAGGFYRALAGEQPVATAVAGGQAQLLAAGLPAALAGQVRLRWAQGVDPASVRF
jgi:hypothetical protein